MATKASTAISNLTLNSSSAKKTTQAKKEAVADSWEDEASGSDENKDDNEDQKRQSSSQDSSSNSGFAAPPPTPSTPTYGSGGAPWQSMASHDLSSASFSDVKRPEKTDAVARRMIASALGVRVPKPTEEQRAYDRALREKERKRREQEKEAERKRQEEAEKAKAAIWED